MKAFIQIIREADRGQLLDDLEEGLEEITGAIEANGGSGEITIKVKVTAKAEGVFEFKTSRSIKIPEPPRLTMLMYRDANGDLGRKDPRQPELPVVVDADFANGRRGRGAEEE